MAPTIRIDHEVYSWLQSQAKAFEDTPNSVLRRVAGIEEPAKAKPEKTQDIRKPMGSRAMISRTHQQAFRRPLIAILKSHDGELHRKQALVELEVVMRDQLTKDDKALINSGTVRWEKSAEWEVRKLREEGILLSVHQTPRGIWKLSDKGWQVAADLENTSIGE